MDANIVIYSLEGFTPHRDRARALFALAERGGVGLVTSELTLAEVLVGPLRNDRADIAALYRELLGAPGLIETIPVDRLVWSRSAEIRAKFGGKLPHSVHVATAAVASCHLLLTGDRGLRGSPDLRVVRLTDMIVD